MKYLLPILFSSLLASQAAFAWDDCFISSDPSSGKNILVKQDNQGFSVGTCDLVIYKLIAGMYDDKGDYCNGLNDNYVPDDVNDETGSMLPDSVDFYDVVWDSYARRSLGYVPGSGDTLKTYCENSGGWIHSYSPASDKCVLECKHN